MAISKVNPSEETTDLSIPKGYRPMSVGNRSLEVGEKAGWHRHWFRGTASNMARAQQAGYRFVEKDEIELNDLTFAGGDDKGTDLGSRVSVISGDDAGLPGQAGRLYLMECPEHLWKYSQSLIMEQNDATADALKGGMVGAGSQGETGKDVGNRYMKEKVTAPLFNRK